MINPRRIGTCLLGVAALAATTSIAFAAPGGHRSPPPKRGTYALHATQTKWANASFKVAKKGGGLVLEGMRWTETHTQSMASDGSCEAGNFTVKGAQPVRWIRSTGTHHQHVWAVGRRQKSADAGIGPVKVVVQTATGTQNWALEVIFTKAKHIKPGQFAFSPGGLLANHKTSCGYEFTPRHS